MLSLAGRAVGHRGLMMTGLTSNSNVQNTFTCQEHRVQRDLELSKQTYWEHA